MQNNRGISDLASEKRYLKGHVTRIFENRSSLLDLAPVSISLKLLQMNL